MNNITLDNDFFGVGVLCYKREKETMQTLLNLEKRNIKNVIIVQDGSSKNVEIQKLSEKISKIANEKNWVYIFDGTSKGATESAWKLFDLCSVKFKYFLFNEDDILISDNYFKCIEIFLEQKKLGLLPNIVSMSPYAEYRHYKNIWTKSKIFHVWGALIESDFYKNFYVKSITKGLKNWRKPKNIEFNIWNDIFLLSRKANENIYDAQFNLALLSSNFYQIRTPLNEAIHIGYGENSTHFKNLSEGKITKDVDSWRENLSKYNQKINYCMDKAIEDEFAMRNKGINIFSLLANYFKLIISDFLKIINIYI